MKTEPIYVVEVVMPASEGIYIPQLQKTPRGMAFTTALESQLNEVRAQLESIYGHGNVRFVPFDGYKPHARAAEILEKLRQLTLPGPKPDDLMMCCAVIALHLGVKGKPETERWINVSLDEDGKTRICPSTEDGGVDLANPLWVGGNDERLLAQAMRLLLMWLQGKMRETSAAEPQDKGES
jgi:hypothetical protein